MGNKESEDRAVETVAIRRVLKNGQVTHELTSRNLAELSFSVQPPDTVKSARIQSMADYNKEMDTVLEEARKLGLIP